MTEPQYTDGKHIIAEFWHCQCDDDLLCQTEPLLTQLCNAIAAVDLTLVGKAVHEFSPVTANNENNVQQTSGLTISLLLAESHLCLHTWGGSKAVILDIYVCNFQQDNSEKAEELFKIVSEIFQPSDYNKQIVWRTHQKNI